MSEVGDRARQAFSASRWREAHAVLSAARPESLELDELELLAVSAYLVGAESTSLRAWQLAHAEATRLGQTARGARGAFWLAFTLLNQRDLPRGGGWVDRGRRRLGSEDCVEQGYLNYAAGLRAVFSGDVPAARAAFVQAGTCADRFRDVELATLSRIGEGRCLIVLGEVSAGVALLDEAMVAVAQDELSPVAAGDSFCTVIDACQELLDVERVEAWSDAFSAWCDRWPDLVLYRGQCLLHRAEVQQLHGAWPQARDEVEQALARLARPTGRVVLGAAAYLRADLLRLTGSPGPAELAYGDAGRWGRDPQPGLALLRVDQGRPRAALAALRRCLQEDHEPVARARLLPALVEVALEVGDVTQAHAGAEELAATAARRQGALLPAEADHARGHVLLRSGELRRALTTLRRAVERWRALDAPHHEARARVLLGLACRALGDEDGAALELEAARAALERLGAGPDLRRLEASEAASQTSRQAGGLTARELQVLALVASGRSNRMIATELVISERTVASHVGSILAKLGVGSRAGATAYAYEHGLTQVTGPGSRARPGHVQ